MKSCFVEQSCSNIGNIFFESKSSGPCLIIMLFKSFEHECALYVTFVL